MFNFFEPKENVPSQVFDKIFNPNGGNMNDFKEPVIQINFSKDAYKQAYSVQLKNIIDAIKANADDSEFMTQIRRDIIFLKWEVDEIMMKKLNPKMASKEKNQEVSL